VLSLRGRAALSRRLLIGVGVAALLLAVPIGALPHSIPDPVAPSRGIPLPLREAVLPAASAPGGSVGAIQVSIDDPQTVPTGTYQQLLRIDSSAFAWLINANWSNGVAYYTANITPVYGWIESNASNRSTETLLWVRLYSIPASGSTNLSLFFWPKRSFNLSATGYIGESAPLSRVYGEYDNGAKVFNFYDNFEGNILDPVWSVSGHWTDAVNNGFSVTGVPGNGDFITSSHTFAYPSAVDFYGDLFQSNPATTYLFEGLGTSGCVSCGDAAYVAWGSQGGTNGPTPGAASGSSGTGGVSAYPTPTYAVYTSAILSPTKAVFTTNYTSPQTLSVDIPTNPLPVGLAIAALPNGSLTNTETTQWIRERTYESEMPTVTIASAIAFVVRFAETGIPAGTTWWVNVTAGPSALSSGPTLTLLEANGSYAYRAGVSNPTYLAPTGLFSVQGVSASVTVAYGRVTFNAIFLESGLPARTDWSVSLNG